MELKELAQEALKRIHSAGIDKGQMTCTKSMVHEFELQGRSINLCRTYFNDNYAAKAVSSNRQAKGSVNRWDDIAMTKLIDELKQGLEASPEDSAYAILESPAKREFHRHPLREPELDTLLKSMENFIEWTHEHHPRIHFESSTMQFVQTTQVMVNSAGLCLVASEDYYQGFVMFTGKDDGKTTSFNYVDFTTYDVPNEIQKYSGLESVLELSTRELEDACEISDVKDILITPYALPSLLGFFLQEISTGSLLSGSSIFKGKLGEKLISEKISLFSQPNAKKFPSFSPYTPDGLLTSDGAILEDGVLKSYLVDLYGSHKLDIPPTPFTGSHISMEPGTKNTEEIIAGIDRGILLTRFSGGSPSPNGDFSGVVKNSFLIEKGKVVRPLKETMISGNLIRLFSQVVEVSNNQINNGSDELSWVHAQL